MPLSGTTRYCVNHTTTPMQKNADLNALTTLVVTDGNFNFNPAQGTPARMYFCPTCGYIELYFEPQ